MLPGIGLVDLREADEVASLTGARLCSCLILMRMGDGTCVQTQIETNAHAGMSTPQHQYLAKGRGQGRQGLAVCEY